jgi:hypothetical protein
MVRVPAHQTAETQQLPHDALFLGTGPLQARFSIGGESYPLGANDVLMVPADTEFRFANPSGTEILILEVRPRH